MKAVPRDRGRAGGWMAVVVAGVAAAAGTLRPARADVVAPSAADAAAPAVAARVAAAVAARARLPSVHADPEEIEAALAAAGVAADERMQLARAVARADLPGRVGTLDVFLFLTRDPRWRRLRERFAEFLELPDVTAPPPAAVAALAGYDGVVSLPAVRDLDAAAAACWESFGGAGWGAALELPGVASLAPDAATALSRCEALLVLPGLRELSVEAARALARHEGMGLVIGGLPTLAPDVAAALAECRSQRGLLLPDLVALDSPALAGRIASQDHVFLPRVESLGDGVAAALAKGAGGGDLCLPALRDLSADTAATLAGSGFYWITLGCGATLEPEAAAAIAGHHGPLSFSGPEPPAAAAAGRLAAHGHALHLPHVERIPLPVADALRPHRGPLVLGGLETLDAEQARRLAAHQGRLILAGLRSLDAAAAAALATRAGALELPALAALPADVARALAAADGQPLVLPALRVLAPDAARALATHRGPLVLPGLTALEPEVAAALGGHAAGALVLDGVAALADEAARDLARHSGGPVSLVGVRRLTPESARALAGCQAPLSLDASALDAEAALALARHPGPLALEGVPFLAAVDSVALARLLVEQRDDLPLESVTALDGDAAVAVAETLARTRGRLALPALERISPRALEALRAKAAGLELPPLEALRLVPEAGARGNDDFVAPER